jgi:DNA polymerase-3 subunit beta
VKLNISKSELSVAINLVIRATASRPSVPSLSGILLSAEEGRIKLFASDLETSINTEVAGTIEAEGSVALAGKMIANIIKSLPEGPVILETKEKEGEVLNISAGSSRFEVRTIPTSDFGSFPAIETENSVTLPAPVLNALIKKVSKSVSRDETRAVLTGVLFTVDGPSARMVATDSFRLSLVEQIIESATEKPVEVLIPGKALDEIVRMTKETDKVTIASSQNHILFTFGETAFLTRRLEGTYPNYQQLIPNSWNTQANISHSEMIDSVRRVSLLALNNAAVSINISAENQTLHLSAKSQEMGTAEETLLVKTEGTDNSIAINYNYLLDGLSVIESEFVSIEIQDAMKPGIIRAPEEHFTYLVMPVRAN